MSTFGVTADIAATTTSFRWCVRPTHWVNGAHRCISTCVAPKILRCSRLHTGFRQRWRHRTADKSRQRCAAQGFHAGWGAPARSMCSWWNAADEVIE